MNGFFNKKKYSLLLALLYLFFLNLFYSSYLFAKSAGTSGAIVLRMPFVAQNVALGGAGVATAGEAWAIENNPAGLAFIEKINVIAGHTNVLSDLQMNSLLYSQPIGATMTATLYSKVLTSDNIQRTEYIDWNRYAIVGDFSVRDAVLSASFAQRARQTLSIFEKNFLASYGISIKFINSEIASYKANAIAGDVGIFFQNPFSRFSFGLALTNIGNKLKYISAGDDLPTQFRFGIAYNRIENSKFYFLGDIVWLRDTNPEINLGVDYKLNDFFSLRVGFDSRNDAALGLSTGVGISSRPFKNRNIILNIDYAYKPMDDLGDYHYLNLFIEY